jgi:CBS domain-containing protein
VKIGELVTSEIEIVDPDDSLRTAAQMMAALDAGILPVCAEDRLLGTISDRDIAVRAIAGG